MKTIQKLILISTIALTTLSTQAATYKFMIQDTNVTSATFIGDTGSEVPVVETPPSAPQYDNSNWIPSNNSNIVGLGNFGHYFDMTCDYHTEPDDSQIYWSIVVDDTDINFTAIGYQGTGALEYFPNIQIGTDINGYDIFYLDANSNSVLDNGERTFHVGTLQGEITGGGADKYAVCYYP